MTQPITESAHRVARATVITVTLNSARHVARAVESVIEQDDPTLEYLVIDGASSDDTVAIVESYRPYFGDRLRVTSEPDSGLYAAMNKGLALTSGDLVGILNSDDVYLPGALAAVRETFNATGADIVYGDLLLGDQETGRVARASMVGFESEMTMFHPSTFVRTSAYQRWGHFDTRYRIAADYDLLLRFHGRGARFARVDRVLTAFAPGGVSGRSLQLAREVFRIHRAHFSRRHALRRAVTHITRIAFLESRRKGGQWVLGANRYERLAKHWRRRS